jgi:hypothetical protein
MCQTHVFFEIPLGCMCMVDGLSAGLGYGHLRCCTCLHNVDVVSRRLHCSCMDCSVTAAVHGACASSVSVCDLVGSVRIQCQAPGSPWVLWAMTVTAAQQVSQFGGIWHIAHTDDCLVNQRWLLSFVCCQGQCWASINCAVTSTDTPACAATGLAFCVVTTRTLLL